jgi:sulfoxide reductase heme-binding subunit YedZ
MKKSLFLAVLLTGVGLNAFAAKYDYRVKDVDGLLIETYVTAGLFALVFILLSILIANLIKYEGGTNPKDSGKRRMWFWLLAAFSPVAIFLYEFLMIIPKVQPGPAMSKFMPHPYVAVGVVLVIYILVGFILSKTMKRGKVGNWFPSK